jgi:hypothetical protein
MRILVRQHNGTETDIDLATAVEWIRGGQLTPDSSVFDPGVNRWRRADTLVDLEEAFEAAAVEEKKEALSSVSATPYEFVDLILKLIYGAIAVVVPSVLGLILLALAISRDVTLSAESFMAALGAVALIVTTPYLTSVLSRRMTEDAYARTYGLALRKTGQTAEPIRTAVAAFAIHRNRYQLLTTALILISALIHFFMARSDQASSRFTAVLALVSVLLMILRGYILEWRIANGLFGTTSDEARELIEFVLHNARSNNISGLGAKPFVMGEEQSISIGTYEPQVQP